MKNKNSAAIALRSIDGEDVTTWVLPEDAIARLGRGRSNDVAFSPDGQYFAVGTSIGFWLYELPTLTPIALWDTERGMTSGVSFSPDGSQIVTSTFDGNVKIWDIERGICTTEIDDHRSKSGISSKPVFSKDGQHLAAASFRMQNGKIYTWCPHTGAKIRETEVHSPYNAYPFCFSPDLSLLAGKNNPQKRTGMNIADGDSITIWHVETGEQIADITGHPDPVRKFCFSPCGRFLAAGNWYGTIPATGNWHGTIHVWNVESGQLEMAYTDYGESQMYPYFLPEGKLITAAVSERKVEIWHVEKGEKLDEFEHRGNNNNTVRFSENGTQLAISSGSDIQIWTKDSNSDDHTLSTLHGHIRTMDTLVFSADEKTLAAGFWSDNVLLWDVASRRSYRPESEKLPGISHHVYLSTSGKLVSTCRDGNLLRVWEVGKREPVAELTAAEAKLMRTEAFSPTQHRLARVDTEHNIHIWEWTPTAESESEDSAWKKHVTLVGHTMYIKGLAFSPDGKRLASIAAGRLETAELPMRDARLWDVDAGEEITKLATKFSDSKLYRSSAGHIAGIAFSPRGDIIAGGQFDEIILWDATDGKVLMRIPQPKESRRPITLCFSPCGEYLASGAWWQRGLQKVPIRLWEVTTGENITTFWGHTTDVQCFAFSQDGTLLVSGGHDGAIYLWDLKSYL